MNSLTKNKQSESTIYKMVKKMFPFDELKAYSELTEGYFNVAYEVILKSGKVVVLKVAPPKGVPVMTCEKNIMFIEVEAMKMVAEHTDIPIPEMLGYDASCTICPSPYFFMEKLEGRSLNSIKESLADDTIHQIYLKTGRMIKIINDISCSCFGYPGLPEYQGRIWYPVFCKMMEGVVSDARRANVDLKISLEEMWEYLKRDESAFNEVTEPRLVHWDCWDGNIFVENGNITGIIDWERSIWADPLMEVGFRTYADNTWFQKGYGLENLSRNQKCRALWYDIYLMLLASLECEYRQYETMDTYNWATEILGKQFEQLKMPE